MSTLPHGNFKWAEERDIDKLVRQYSYIDDDDDNVDKVTEGLEHPLELYVDETTELLLPPPQPPMRNNKRNTIINLLTITYKPIIDCQTIYSNYTSNKYLN